jgi:hypothetical protein
MESRRRRLRPRWSWGGVLGCAVLALTLIAIDTAGPAGAEEATLPVASEPTTVPVPGTSPDDIDTQYIDPMLTTGGAGGEDDAQRAYERREERRQDQDNDPTKQPHKK